jgi:hypothetical protein
MSATRLKQKGANPELLDTLDMAEHYDHGNYKLLGEPIAWYAPEKVSPKLVSFYKYARQTMNLPE